MSLLSFRLLLIMWPKYLYDTAVFIREPLRYSLAEGLALNLCPLKLSATLLFSLNFIPFLDAYVSHSLSNFCIPCVLGESNTKEHFYTDIKVYIDGLMLKRCNSIANALELRFSCTNPSIYHWRKIWQQLNVIKHNVLINCKGLWSSNLSYHLPNQVQSVWLQS